MVGQGIDDRRIYVERAAIALEHIIIAAGAVVIARAPRRRGADREFAVVIIDGSIPRPFREAKQRLGEVARDRRLEPVVGGVIDERTADGVIDVALHEGRVAEHAEVAQRIRKDREGQLQRQLDALQAGAGTVYGRPEFELAPRSEERRVGKEWVSTCGCRWSP